MSRAVVPSVEARAGDTLVTSQGPRLIIEVHADGHAQTMIRYERPDGSTRDAFLAPSDDVDLIRP